MATIKAFKALRPDKIWYGNLLCKQEEEFFELKSKLSSSAKSELQNNRENEVENYLFNLIEKGCYAAEEQEGLYVYEQETVSGKQYGVWALTAISDLIEGRILSHENTLAEKQANMVEYRETIGLEGAPILLTYRPHVSINSLIDLVVSTEDHAIFSCENKVHKLWLVKDSTLIAKFKESFNAVDRVYIADGHHRLAAAEVLNTKTDQWIMSLYVSSAEVQIKPFHRMIHSEIQINEALLFDHLQKHFTISAIPANVAYCPDQLHRLGMYYNGNWYQINLKLDNISLQQLTDVVILQEEILAPFFGITSARTDKRLKCYPANSWDEMMEFALMEENVLVFTLFPMSIHQLIEQAEKGIDLPPKSTFIEPKLPYGLLLFSHKLESIS